MASEYLQSAPKPVTDEYYDLGTHSRQITTTNSEAQIWFDRGLNWTYAFNHEEAGNCFQQVIAHDPECAMGYWGVAFAAGPNYNKQWALFDEDDLKHAVRKGYHVVRAAEERMDNATPVEKGLIQALKHRFPRESVAEDFEGVNKDYADAMRDVYRHHGKNDLDITTLLADALMNTSPWGLYDSTTGKANLATPVLEIKEVLEAGLALPMAKTHPGINHLYIHLMEMSATPEAALIPAEHLRDLVPDAGHLRHMPSHLDILVGDYRRSVDGNMKATLADDKFYARHGGKNFYSFYRLHNYHSLIYACMLSGRSQLALESVARMESTLTEEMLAVKSPPLADWLEFFNSVRVHVLIRFGRWDELKDLPIPEDKDLYCVTVVMTHYGKAIAFAATGDVANATNEQTLFQSAAKRVPPTRMDFLNPVPAELTLASEMLSGELEYRRGNYNSAFAHLRQAVQEEDNLHYSEPGWLLPARHALGALLLEQGHVSEAADVYAEDLGLSGREKSTGGAPCRHPGNVWALHGYHECLTRLEREAEAGLVWGQLKVALAVADVEVSASCFCRLGVVDKNGKEAGEGGCGCG